MLKKASCLIVLCIALLCACAKTAPVETSPTNTVTATQVVPTYTATTAPTETATAVPTETATIQPTRSAEADPTDTKAPPTPVPVQAFGITSPSFAHEQMIPVQHTCDGKDTSPELAWTTPPPGTKSLVLIADDPDAPGGTWVHWVLFNIPADAAGLTQGVPADEQLPDGSIQGKNSWPRTGYSGPCPPSGTHRYYFKLYALDTILSLDASATKEHVIEAMTGHALAETELMGTYTRK